MANFEEMAAVEARKKDEKKDSLPRWVIPTIVAVSVASLITIIAAVVTKLLVSCHVMAMFPTYKTISRRKYKVKFTLTLISAQHERVLLSAINLFALGAKCLLMWPLLVVKTSIQHCLSK